MRIATALALSLLLPMRGWAASWDLHFNVSPRIEYNDGLGEFYAALQEKNAFPEVLGANQQDANRRRIGTQVSEFESYKALRSLYEPYGPPDVDGSRAFVFLQTDGEYRFARGWRAGGQLASRELGPDALDDGRVEMRGRSSFFIDTAYVGYERWDDWKSFSAGRLGMSSGRGFLLDDYQVGAQAKADLDLMGAAPLTLSAQLAKLEAPVTSVTVPWGSALFDPRASAFFGQVTVGYPISALEGVNFSYARFQDRDGYFAAVLNPMIDQSYRHAQMRISTAAARKAAAEAKASPLKTRRETLETAFENEYERARLALLASQGGLVGDSSSALHFALAEGDLLFGPVGLAWVLIGEWGTVNLLDIAPGLKVGGEPVASQTSFATRGLLGYAKLDVPLGKKWTVRGHYLFSSGDNQAGTDGLLTADDSWSSFLALRPYIRLTNLFFSGGISENLRTGSLSPSGYGGHGVWATVADAQWDPSRKVSIVATGAYLHAQQKPSEILDPYGEPVFANQGGVYGWEGDLIAYYQPWPWLRLAAEGDVFLPGDFFVDLPTVWKAGLGVDLFFDFAGSSRKR